MKSIYQLFGGYGNDPLKVFDYYFKHGSWAGNGYVEALIIVAVLAIVCVCIFYFVIGNTSFKLSNKVTWGATWVVAILLTFIVTDINTGMSSSGSGKYGLQKTLDLQWRKKTKDIDTESSQYKELEKCRRNHQLHFKKGVFSVKPVMSLCLVNSCIMLLLFPVLSLAARKGPTKYAQNIPIK